MKNKSNIHAVRSEPLRAGTFGQDLIQQEQWEILSKQVENELVYMLKKEVPLYLIYEYIRLMRQDIAKHLMHKGLREFGRIRTHDRDDSYSKEKISGTKCPAYLFEKLVKVVTPHEGKFEVLTEGTDDIRKYMYYYDGTNIISSAQLVSDESFKLVIHKAVKEGLEEIVCIQSFYPPQNTEEEYIQFLQKKDGFLEGIRNSDDKEYILTQLGELTYSLSRQLLLVRGSASASEWLTRAVCRWKNIGEVGLLRITEEQIPFDIYAQVQTDKKQYIFDFVSSLKASLVPINTREEVYDDKTNISLPDAIKLGKADLVHQAITRGQDPDAAYEGATPLHHAILSGCIATANALILRGADIKIPTEDGIDSLFLAVDMNVIEIVEQLLRFGANPNVTAPNGLFPLVIAARKDKCQVVDKLLSHGAEPLQSLPDGTTALDYARSFQILSRLIEASLSSHATVSPEWRLMFAVYQNDIEAVRSLVKEGVDINMSTLAGWTPLLLAFERDNTELVVELVKIGAKNADRLQPDQPLTMMQQVIARGDRQKDIKEIIQALIQAGANVRQSIPLNFFDTSKRGRTLIETVLTTIQCELIPTLLDHGLNINESSRENGRYTPLGFVLEQYSHLSIPERQKYEHVYFQTIQTLVSAGADPNLRINDELPAFLQAIQIKAPAIIDYFVRKGVDINICYENIKYQDRSFTPLQYAIMSGANIQLITMLIEKLGADVDLAPEDSWPPVFWAVFNNDKDMVDLLIDHQVDVNCANHDYIDPLSFAILYGNNDIAEKLIQAGAKLKSNVPVSVDSILLQAESYGIEAQVNSLLQKVIDPSLPDEIEISHLELSILLGHKELTTMLINKGCNIDRNAVQLSRELAEISGNNDMLELLSKYSSPSSIGFFRAIGQSVPEPAPDIAIESEFAPQLLTHK